MPKTESIVLFYRDAFPISYQFATKEVSWRPMKNERVSQLCTKGWLSRTRGPILLLPSSQEELFSYSALRRICSFSLHLPVHLTYLM